jgi:hypothetical protein
MPVPSMLPGRSLNPGWLEVWGEFAPNGSSAVDATTRKGRYFTVARTSAGLFTVTITIPFTDAACPWAHLRLGTAGDQKAETGNISVSGRTMEIRVWDISGAAVADVAADPTNIISFSVRIRRQKIGPIRG